VLDRPPTVRIVTTTVSEETYLRAWRAFHGFENRSSVRTWIYRIATNACLTALGGAARRPLPTGPWRSTMSPASPLRRARRPSGHRNAAAAHADAMGRVVNGGQ